MADSYVCSGAIMRCSCGSNTSVLKVLPDRTVMLAGNPPMANISDIKTGINIPSFGLCATTIIPTPCTPAVAAPWQNGKMDYLVRNNPALLKSSTCVCGRGGIIRIIDDGQYGASPGIEKQQKEDIKKADSLVLWDAYWEKTLAKNNVEQTHTTKLRFIPWQEKVNLVLAFYYEYDDEKKYDKGDAIFKLKIEIPDTIFSAKEYTIKGSDVQKGQTNESVTINRKTRMLYKYVILDFSSDLTEARLP